MGKSDQYCRPLPKTSRFAKADPSTETLKKALFPGRKGGKLVVHLIRFVFNILMSV